MAKPQASNLLSTDRVIASLLKGPKKPHEIVMDINIPIQEKCRNNRLQESRTDGEIKKIVKRDGIAISTVHSVLRTLKKEGRIAQKDKFGRYHLTGLVLENPQVAGWMFAAGLRDGGLTGGQRGNTVLYWGMNRSLFREPLDLQAYLKESATVLGAYIIYLFLESMNPSGLVKTSAKRGTVKYGEDRDESALVWIRSALPFSHLLFDFRMWPGFPRFGDVIRFSNRSHPWFELDEKDFERIMREFRLVFPDLYDKLEECKRSVPDNLNLRNKFVESFHRIAATEEKI
jgi:hypothetical protein